MNRRLIFLTIIMATSAVAAHAQVAPPYFTSLTPPGAQRGRTVELTLEGFNLSGAREILWDQAGIEARVINNVEQPRERPKLLDGDTRALIVDKAVRNRLTIEAVIAPDAQPGLYSFRLVTSLGTSNLGRFEVGELEETGEREMNDSAAEAQLIQLPTTVTGEIGRRGDSDHFKFTARAGQQIVFDTTAITLGSRLDSVLTLLDARGSTLASNNDLDARRDALLAHTFKEDGEYIIRITDYERGGGAGTYAYRLRIGELPFLTSVFPLGLRRGTAAEFALSGYNLSRDRERLTAPAESSWDGTFQFRPETGSRSASNKVRLAAGRYPEVTEPSAPTTLARPLMVALPVTINGRLRGAGGEDPADYYRFAARKGQRLMLEVEAQRLGSPLDAVIEVLDAKGQLVPRALARCLLETSVTLADRDSASRGLRLVHWNGIEASDYLLVGQEILQVEVLPKTPDEDVIFRSVGGQRIGFYDTTPEAHAVNTAVYKVSIHPPGTTLPPNGLPVVTLYYRNDDGGPLYGKDSKLTFTAPADGEYTVRLRDVRGMGGERFAYRLSIRQPEPDFRLSVDPENPNVPAGGQIPLAVTASRLDGFDGEIEVKALDLPAGFTANVGVIPAGQDSTIILLTAPAGVRATFPLRVQGTAQVAGKRLARETRVTDRVSVVSVGAPPELIVTTEPDEVMLTPGSQAMVTVRVRRERGFTGRVPVDVRNLPYGVIVKDVGLNGVLITEEEESQRFLIAVEPWVVPTDQPIFVVGRIETTSPQRLEFPARPFKLIIRAKESAARQSGTK